MVLLRLLLSPSSSPPLHFDLNACVVQSGGPGSPPQPPCLKPHAPPAVPPSLFPSRCACPSAPSSSCRWEQAFPSQGADLAPLGTSVSFRRGGSAWHHHAQSGARGRSSPCAVCSLQVLSLGPPAALPSLLIFPCLSSLPLSLTPHPTPSAQPPLLSPGKGPQWSSFLSGMYVAAEPQA